MLLLFACSDYKFSGKEDEVGPEETAAAPDQGSGSDASDSEAAPGAPAPPRVVLEPNGGPPGEADPPTDTGGSPPGDNTPGTGTFDPNGRTTITPSTGQTPDGGDGDGGGGDGGDGGGGGSGGDTGGGTTDTGQVPDGSGGDPPDTGTPDEETPPDTDGSGGGSGTETEGGELPEGACEEAARTAGYLDHFQVAGDGRVLFCHRGGGPNYTEIATDISACLSHFDHDNDLFPTTLCDS